MMLSTISHPMSSPSSALSHHVDSPSNMTTSLPILPQRQPALSHPPRNLPARPKLQINTQQVRTFGKGSTSLRLDTLSAISPTVRNTFSNAYEPASASGRKPRLSIDSNLTTEPSNPPTISTPSSASTLSSTLTSASTESATIKIPYKQPHNLTSILSNSPARNLIPRKMAPVRPFFPAEKKVSFRTPLEEEIKTSKYTMAHSELDDLESSVSSGSTVASIEVSSTPSESESSSGSLAIATSSSSSSDVPSSPSEQSSSSSNPNSSTFSSLETSPRPRGPRAGDKRDSSESDSDSAPETPVAGRRKRTRDWRWTLGPLPSDKSSSASTSDTTTTDEDSN